MILYCHYIRLGQYMLHIVVHMALTKAQRASAGSESGRLVTSCIEFPFFNLITVFQLDLPYPSFPFFLFIFLYLFYHTSSHFASRCLRALMSTLHLHRCLPYLRTQVSAPQKTWRRHQKVFFYRRRCCVLRRRIGPLQSRSQNKQIPLTSAGSTRCSPMVAMQSRMIGVV